SDDPLEPVADTMQSLLDGHIHLDRRIAQLGRYPAIHVPMSLSRLQRKLLPHETQSIVDSARKIMATYMQHEELIRIGGYENGTDPALDQAVALHTSLEQFLAQETTRSIPMHETVRLLRSILGQTQIL
ncbi:MAG: flagellum-specific ATP synthase FliI, partial [Planctomycetota bacterium]